MVSFPHAIVDIVSKRARTAAVTSGSCLGALEANVTFLCFFKREGALVGCRDTSNGIVMRNPARLAGTVVALVAAVPRDILSR